jgi:hypothetical protein
VADMAAGCDERCVCVCVCMERGGHGLSTGVDQHPLSSTTRCSVVQHAVVVSAWKLESERSRNEDSCRDLLDDGGRKERGGLCRQPRPR